MTKVEVVLDGLFDDVGHEVVVGGGPALNEIEKGVVALGGGYRGCSGTGSGVGGGSHGDVAAVTATWRGRNDGGGDVHGHGLFPRKRRHLVGGRHLGGRRLGRAVGVGLEHVERIPEIADAHLRSSGGDRTGGRTGVIGCHGTEGEDIGERGHGGSSGGGADGGDDDLIRRVDGRITLEATIIVVAVVVAVAVADTASVDTRGGGRH